ncbi:bifunctional riboflavin kinase/FAD synthetase [Peptostreptococcus canis]|uniref:Riboflavin biosynthesis protein n=1 Tax=Peptostreptococcus canis TaxID=1159213 RepID=A0ABR6TNS9_9FIRM|nr:bifunctional riboflavin kinase/FAD synthetase [Peptostreptococcus canis]MBC2576828.1 bifunctional riboflavin kinase/FAD synthetase [Peptostreptococcus canis]MBP1998898.1 riboflavin kinase/FMN adenylyltransferase [Peptostreptococcus canis]
MLVFNNIDEIDISCDTCVTIGNFDGVHKGHQTLMKKAIEYSKLNNLKSVVFTFANHPVNYFKPGYVKNIITYDEKKTLLEDLGVDVLVNIPFGVEMTEISAEDYVQNILIDKLHVKKLIVGHDFTFARKREGNVEVLKKLSTEKGFELEIVTPVLVDGKRVSSTDIRAMIAEGDVSGAEKLLGRYFAVEGIVIRARQIGRTIGFPTANLDVDKNMVIPQKGIYATIAKIDNRVFCGATSIGTNPTVNGKGLSIETYILDFDEDIYDQRLRIEFVERMRDEIKFDSVEGLKEQLTEDVEYVRKNYVRHCQP